MSRRGYSGSAISTTITASIASTDTTFSVVNASTLPSANFVLTLDSGLNEEKTLVGSRVGTTMNGVTRGYDGTVAVAHSSGASARHTLAAVDLDEANSHVNTGTAVHGLAGAVVGTTDTQTLTNKSFTSPTVTGTPSFPAASLPESVVTNLTGDLAQRAKVVGVGASVYGGTPPTVATGGFLIQSASYVMGSGYITGGTSIPFPAAFTTGVIAAIAILGDGGPNYVSVIETAYNTSGFAVKIFNSAGVEVAAGGIYRINYIAVGW